MEGEKWLSVGEVAFRWRVSRDTVIRRIKDGLIQAFVLPRKSNRRVRVYQTRMIALSEVLRIERGNTGHV